MPFCKQCGKEISQDARYCPYCGADQFSQAQSVVHKEIERKNAGLAAVLALIAGIFGIWGIGHIYIGKIGKGIVLLILGFLLTWVTSIFLLAPMGIFFGIFFGAMHRGLSGFFMGLLGVIAIWILVCFVIFVWQVYDAYRLAKYYNEYVQQHGKEPW